MNLICRTALILRNTFLVTLLVALGFMASDALNLPSWLGVFCLIPAGWLFMRLSGETPVQWGKLIGFLAVVSGFLLLTGQLTPQFPANWRTPMSAVAAGLMTKLLFNLEKWYDRRFSKSSFSVASTGLSSFRFPLPPR
jgi:Na+-transporting NADH:ubiquinone oxidoreductase subunit NqrB